MQNRGPNRLPVSQPRGFTLMELLIAIGIIILLIGILIPTVSRVRQSAYEADTKQQLASLINAIELYHADHGAYPGPLSNDDIAGRNPTLAFENVDPEAITGTENLVLGLLGGAESNWITGITAYDWEQVGRGANSLNPDNPKRYNAYMDGNDLSWNRSGFSPSAAAGRFKDDSGQANDTEIPEFVDRFPSAMPILYLRANPGTSGVATEDPDNVAQYDLEQILGYTETPIGGPKGGVHGLRALGAESDPLDYEQPNTLRPYLKHPTLSGEVRQKNGFVLISAGRDRIYGTIDDITNFGSVGQ